VYLGEKKKANSGNREVDMKTYVELIQKYITEEALIERTSDLVRCPSYDGIENQETETALHIKAMFDAEDIPCTVEEVTDGRCNVYAKLSGTGGGRTLLLTGHTDTVSVDNHPRGLDPYIENDNLVGRGTCDMKGALAAMISAMIAIKRSGVELSGDIIFAGCIDEEMRSYGTIAAIERGIKADGAIVGEPTGLQVHIAQRGLEWYEFNFIGKTVHGGRQREGINAILMANRFITKVDEELAPKVFARKHPLLTEATLNIGVIHGGTGLSTVPGACKLLVDRRFLPEEDYDEVGGEFQAILDELAEQDPKFKCEMKVMDVSVMKPGYVHQPFETAVDAAVVVSARKAANVVRGIDEQPIAHVAWTDAAMFSRYGSVPSIIMGPGAGVVCHSEYEYVPVKELVDVSLQYALTAIDFCS
jgi:acetylornithine deacetylase/succinyl-diaminopimelate desuccinylase